MVSMIGLHIVGFFKANKEILLYAYPNRCVETKMLLTSLHFYGFNIMQKKSCISHCKEMPAH